MVPSYLCVLVTFVLAITRAANAEIFIDDDVADPSEADVVPKNRTSFPVRLIERQLTYFSKQCVEKVERKCSNFSKYEKPRLFSQCAFRFLLRFWDRCFIGRPTTVRPIKSTTPTITGTTMKPNKSTTPTITGTTVKPNKSTTPPVTTTTVKPNKSTTPPVTTTTVQQIKSTTSTITTTASSVPGKKRPFSDRIIDRTLAYFTDECVEEAKKRCKKINRHEQPRVYTRCTVVDYLIPIWQRCIKIR